jgi:hypothetical protein
VKNLRILPRGVRLTKKQPVAWIQSFLELICGWGGGEGPGPPYSGEKSWLEPSRDWENMIGSGGEPIFIHEEGRSVPNRVRRLLLLITE